MLHLIKIEWLKLKYYRTFWILASLFVLGVVGFNYIVYQGYMSKPQGADMILNETPYHFPDIWQTITYFSSFLLFIPGLLVIIFFTNEYSFKTHRQNIIDGLSRGQFIYVKMMILFLQSILCTLLVLLTALIFGLVLKSPMNFSNMEFIGYFFVQTLSYSFVALLFGLLFKRSGIAIGVYFLYVLVFDELIAILLKKYVGKIGYYMPLETNDVMITVPFGRRAINSFVHRPDVTSLLLMSVAYLILYFFFIRRRFEKSDL